LKKLYLKGKPLLPYGYLAGIDLRPNGEEFGNFRVLNQKFESQGEASRTMILETAKL
jgi:hypothetical protein